MQYAAILSSHSDDSPGIIGPLASAAAAGAAGAAVCRAQPGIRAALVTRASDAQPWAGADGAAIREVIRRMVEQ